ncbi:unnamed protein product [Coregonus sp. 'balchen']|nr:unnamed protein product [Coregonus sp. 'balchen']
MMEVLNHLSTLLLLSLLPPSLSHVVGKFSDVPECSDFFLEGTTPNLPGILVGGTVKDQNRYKPICQKYKNSYRFATLYDTINKIPVFSAYTFTGPPTDPRPDPPWMIEPQLNDIKNSPEMSKDKGQSPYPNQAGNNDYKNSIDSNGVNRGHLFPCSHAHDLETQKSTFTLTNIVPQVETFNGGSWKDMEDYVRTTLQNDCLDNNGKIKAYVVTGAAPSTNNELNNRVNIPDLLWTAYCCYNSNQRQWVAGAHWGENINEKKGKTLKTESLGALENKLNKGVQVFPQKCPRGLNTAPSWFGSIVSTLRNLKNSVMNRIG